MSFIMTLPLPKFPGLFQLIQLQVGKEVRPFSVDSFRLEFYILVGFSHILVKGIKQSWKITQNVAEASAGTQPILDTPFVWLSPSFVSGV